MDTLLDPDFQWDGTHSDLAQQFYRAHIELSSANKSLPQASMIDHEDLPDDIQRRLATYSLRFESLPSLLQRALVWDTGYVFGSGAKLLRVFTASNKSMAQIAVSPEVFVSGIGCSANNCSSQYRSLYCNGRQILSVANCVTDAVYRTTHTAMWATGTGRRSNDVSDDPVLPSMDLLRHQWTDTDANLNVVKYLVYGIHTVRAADQPSWSKCPVEGKPQATGLTIPCGVYRAQGDPSKWSRPPHGPLVDQWMENVRLKQNATSSDGGKTDKSRVAMIILVL